ncbi:CAZyme family GT25 [Paecilomyces variotii]|nr:CAZyme family GT25 [Paecilomyces variotii]KAJ9352199.1 CAZyme family GT25 [Paecilomyces variotii]
MFQMEMPLSTSQRKRYFRLFLYLLVGAILVFALWPLPSARPTLRGGSAGRSHLSAIKNETLGVQKIFVVNLPSRPDKRDAIVLGSSIIGFHIDWIDGVTPDQLNPKSYPYNWNPEHKPSEYAARRAHVNAMQRIVDERLCSAIVMEDDADWDVTLKTQLQSFAVAVRALQSGSHAHTASPYGDDWDVLWLGHCGLECRTDLPYFLTPHDPTVLPPGRFLPYWRQPPPIERPDHARLTCTASDAVCSIVYAVSYRGAQKILSALSVDPSVIAEQVDTGAQFDVSLGRMCGIGYLRCFAPYPSLTGGYRSAGPTTKSSDINNHEGGDMEGAFSSGLMYSTMLNINRILNGESMVRSTWDDAEVPEVNPNDIPVVGGKVMRAEQKA